MRFPSRGFIIGLLLAAGLLLGLLGAWALWRGRERPGAGPARDGPTLYAAHCAGCHGPTGKGDGPGASVLRQRMRDFTDGAAMAQVNDAFLAEIIRKGGSQFGRSNAMPAWGMKLTDDEIQSLVAYIRSLAPGGPPAAPGSAEQGGPGR